VTAKRIRRLLEPLAGPVPARTVRAYVARLRREVSPKEAFVHRTHLPGQTVEVDFGESWAEVAGQLHKCKILVATLPHSNVYFAKAYPVERLECLLDGLLEAFTYFGGVPERLVLDNTALAVKQVLVGRERKETRDFHAFRGAFALHVDFCGPGKGWEKGSVETGVKYVRNTAFRPRPQVASWAALNAHVLCELEADLKTRRLADGRTVREAWGAERASLRPLPSAPVETCRALSRVADKFGHVRVDRVRYCRADPLRLPADLGEALPRPRGAGRGGGSSGAPCAGL
jgi:transposase